MGHPARVRQNPTVRGLLLALLNGLTGPARRQRRPAVFRPVPQQLPQPDDSSHRNRSPPARGRGPPSRGELSSGPRHAFANSLSPAARGIQAGAVLWLSALSADSDAARVWRVSDYLQVSTATETREVGVRLAEGAVAARLAASAQVVGPVTQRVLAPRDAGHRRRVAGAAVHHGRAVPAVGAFRPGGAHLDQPPNQRGSDRSGLNRVPGVVEPLSREPVDTFAARARSSATQGNAANGSKRYRSVWSRWFGRMDPTPLARRSARVAV